MRGTKVRAALGIARRQLTHGRGGTVLSILGVTVAVLLLTLLMGIGYGMTQAGTEAITYLEPDLWVTASGSNLTAGAISTSHNSILNAHQTATTLENHPDVKQAQAMGFQTIYVSNNKTEFTTVVGVGVMGGASSNSDKNDTNDKSDFFTRSDPHYANGTYTGRMTHGVVLSPEVANRLHVSTGDTIYLGGTKRGAKNRTFTVVGISQRFSTFLGTPAATLYLSEYQEVTGKTASDRALLIGLVLTEDANVTTVKRELQHTYPGLEFRTGQEQLRVVFKNQGAVIASTITLVSVAVATGIALVANTLALLVARQRRELAALKAIGLRGRTLVTIVAGQGISIGTIGGVCGLILTPFAVRALNRLVKHLVGFPELIKTPWWIFAIGGGIALVIGLSGASVAGWYVARVNPLANLTD